MYVKLNLWFIIILFFFFFSGASARFWAMASRISFLQPLSSLLPSCPVPVADLQHTDKQLPPIYLFAFPEVFFLQTFSH